MKGEYIMLGNIAKQYIDEQNKVLSDLSKKIWEKPEVAFNEYYASDLLAKFLQEQGFDVETQYAGVPTAFRASWGSGKPVIGFLGEYDALPGMSQKVSLEKEAVEEGEAGHACQHNLLGVGHIGAVLGMKKEMEERNLSGTIVFYGCPAEEGIRGKVFMARGGAFRDLDAFFAWHPGATNLITLGTMAAMDNVKFHFKGITAHAGGDPHNGRSALDAVEIMNVAANYLREHVTDDVRMHYVITNGGEAPNIVPDKATVWYYVRALSREAVKDTYDRLVKAAKGAALATETEVEIEFLGGCYNTLQNKVLGELVYETMKEVEMPTWNEDELDFAKKLDRGVNNKSMFPGATLEKGHIHQDVLPIINMNAYGSTDVADVQHIAPGVFFMTATSNIGAAGHSWHNTVCAGNSIGQKGMIYASKVMAVAGLKALEDAEIIRDAKSEFTEAMGGQKYECPIPEGLPIPKE